MFSRQASQMNTRPACGSRSTLAFRQTPHTGFRVPSLSMSTIAFGSSQTFCPIYASRANPFFLRTLQTHVQQTYLFPPVSLLPTHARTHIVYTGGPYRYPTPPASRGVSTFVFAYREGGDLHLRQWALSPQVTCYQWVEGRLAGFLERAWALRSLAILFSPTCNRVLRVKPFPKS